LARFDESFFLKLIETRVSAAGRRLAPSAFLDVVLDRHYIGVSDPGRNHPEKTLIVDGERAFDYVYDYGDDWRCVVVLEATAPMIRGLAYPRLVEGARRGPPEDVGGPWSYSEFLEAIADPKHERHTELLEWCGGDFDPQQLNFTEINRSLTSRRAKPPFRAPALSRCQNL
jgi:hypothetical protein